MYQAFQAVTVCGHGSAHEAGIKLAGRRWDGTGCDWRAVNLLLMVSCSVGRLEQTDDQDIEGLCVRLALHRARSVVACRWPVIAPQAIAFSNEVVAQYLELRRQASEGTTTGDNLWARAVNAARHRFLGGGDTRSDGEIVQLNTVAAFELYGLGRVPTHHAARREEIPVSTMSDDSESGRYTLVAFDRHGVLRDNLGAVDRLIEALGRVTDVFVFSHGWLNNRDQANAHYQNVIRAVAKAVLRTTRGNRGPPAWIPAAAGRGSLAEHTVDRD